MFQIYPERPGCYWSLTNWIWQVDAISRLYRSRHDKAGTTKVALVKATKHKADPATNEIRVENRNHGLAGSQSGNNKTVQTLLSFSQKTPAKDSYYLQKNTKLESTKSQCNTP